MNKIDIKKDRITLIVLILSLFYYYDYRKSSIHTQLDRYELIFHTYSQDIIGQNETIDGLLNKIDYLETNLKNLKKQNSEFFDSINLKVKTIDAAINSKTKRWEEIKKTRKIVLNTISKNNYQTFMNIVDLTRYSGAVVDYASKYNVSIPLILAVTRQESAFNPKAVSHAGAKGLMQLMPATAKECSLDIGKRTIAIFDIRTNVQLGTFYLRRMLTKFDENMEIAIKAYNAGPTYVSKVLANEYSSYPEETVDYSEKVLKYFKEYNLNYK